MFLSAHYAGEDMVMKVKAGDSWKKVFGPVFTYLNCLPDKTSDPLSLWQDAKNQVYPLTNLLPFVHIIKNLSNIVGSGV